MRITVDHYDALEVAPSATTREIRVAYLRLARHYHPDTNAGVDAGSRRRYEERMQQVNVAWSVLGDEARRREYDQVRLPPRPTPGRAPTGGGGDPWAFRPYDDSDDPGPPPADDRGVETHSQGLSMAPVLLFVASVISLIFGSMTGITPLIALAGVCFIAALLLFVLVPLLALTASRRHELK